VTVQDVLAFFAQHDVVDRVADGPDAAQLLPKANGKPSGQAVVQMRSRQDAETARGSLHGQYMDTRYIEVFVYGGNGGVRGSGNEANGSAAVGQLQDGVPQWGMGVSPCMPWEALHGHPRASGSATEGHPAGGAGSADPGEWSALFEFLYKEPQPDAGGLGIGGAATHAATHAAFLPGAGSQPPTNDGVTAPVPVDQPAQPPMQTLRV